MMNTGFVFDPIVRFYKRDIDFSMHTTVNDNFFIDFFFEISDAKGKKEGFHHSIYLFKCL